MRVHPCGRDEAEPSRSLGRAHLLGRHVVSNIATNDPEERNAAEQEVETNTKQIANTMTPYYGEAASEKLYRLLDGNIDAVEEYSEATVAGE